MSFRMAARTEVEEPPAFDLIEPGWYDVELLGIQEPIQSQYPLSAKYGERAGELPWNTCFRYQMLDGSEYVQFGKWFDMENPYDKNFVAEVKGIVGHELADDEDFEVDDYLGTQLQILIVHEDRKQGPKKGQPKAVVSSVRRPKLKAQNGKPRPNQGRQRPVVEDVDPFPDDVEF
jgi:hypothetical protein